MTKLQVYSILVTLDKTMRWSLDGYKHHALTGASALKSQLRRLINCLIACRRRLCTWAS